MTAATIVLFAIAALLGATMAIQRFRGTERPPLGLALAHGLFAAPALILLIVAVVRGGGGGLITPSLALFIAAALGGFLMFSMHLRQKALPIPLVLIHGLAAAIGFVLLLAAVA